MLEKWLTRERRVGPLVRGMFVVYAMSCLIGCVCMIIYAIFFAEPIE